VAVDSAGDLFVADTGNQRIRRVDLPGATITTVAGNGTAGFGGDGGPATRARLHSPFGVAVTAGGDVVVADSGNNRVRIVRAGSGVIDTVAGNGTAGYAAGSWPAALAPLAGVASVAAWDPGGSETRSRVFLADPFTHSVRQVDERGRVTTVVGNGSAGPGDGQLANPFGVATDRASPPRVLYVADTFNHRIQRVDLAAGTVSTAAGTGQPGGGGDGGPAGRAQLSFPTGISVDAAGDLFIADTYNARIRRVDAASGVITTVAGTGRLGSGGDGGPAVGADLFFPHGVATSGADPPDLYVADTFNNRVRRVDGRTGIVTTVAGDGTPARLDRPWGVAVDDAPHPDVYIADTGNGVLRRLDGMSAAVTKFLPGTAPLVDFDPGQPLTAGPRGVAVPRHVTGGEVNPAPGKLVLVADSRPSRAARAGLALADPSAAAVAFQTTSFDLGCGATCPTQTIDVTNPGSATLAVRQVVIRGDQAGDFRVTADGCSRRAVPPGQRCRLRLAFSPGGTCPTTDPCRQAQLAITTNGADGDHVVLLAGSAVRQGPDMRATSTATNSGVGTVTASDDATVSPRPGGPVPSGTATFFLCGPLPSAAGCPAGGNAVGAAKTLDPDGHAVSDSTPVAAPANQEAEYWCWRAEYSGDVFYLPALHTDTTGQCFGVLPGGFVLSP
jgi:sugar lactone lactonase YvrE